MRPVPGGRSTWLVAVVLVIVSTGTVAGIQTYTIDDDHGLAESSAIDEYDRTGNVSTSLVAPELTIQIAQEHEDAGVNARRADAPYHYLRIEYDETLPAIFRIHVPEGYWHPQPQNIDSITDSAEAELRPAEVGEYTIVTVRFDGPTDAVFPVPVTASWVFATRDRSSDLVENHTDVEVPSLGSQSEWHYIDRSKLTGNNATVKILGTEDLTVQYDVSRSNNRWLSVPACTSSKGRSSPVCQFDRDGVDEHTFVLLRTADPPPIRYKSDPGPIAQLRSVGDGISVSIDNLLDMVGGWFGVIAW